MFSPIAHQFDNTVEMVGMSTHIVDKFKAVAARLVSHTIPFRLICCDNQHTVHVHDNNVSGRSEVRSLSPRKAELAPENARFVGDVINNNCRPI